MKINVIGVPLNLGCDRQGVELAPNKLREYGLLGVIRGNGHRAFDLGNLYIPPVTLEDKYTAHSHMKYLDAILEVNTNLAELVYDTLQGDGFPIVVGGDHSLGLGSASGVGKCFDDFGIIWIDAHGDINTSETSPSGNVHGMPLSALMGEGSKELVDLYHPGNKVNPENVFLVATRDLDKGEQDMIQQKKLNVYSMETIHKHKIAFVVEEIKKKLLASKVKNIHLSIDIDSIDPDYAPGTGTKVKDGLSVAEFYELIDGILALNVVKSIDLVELNPLLDDKKNSTTRLCIDIIDFITKRI